MWTSHDWSSANSNKHLNSGFWFRLTVQKASGSVPTGSLSQDFTLGVVFWGSFVFWVFWGVKGRNENENRGNEGFLCQEYTKYIIITHTTL